VTDSLAAITNGANSIDAFAHHRYLAAGGYAVGAGLSGVGAGIGAKAVSASISKAVALGAATRAGGAFAALDHALPEGTPALQPAALWYLRDSLGAYQASARSAALWGQASLAMTLNGGIAIGMEDLWNRSQ
jgi:hypothetical protein